MNPEDPRITLQAHRLRTIATRRATMHGSQKTRTDPPYVKYLIISLAVAFAILIGIVAGGAIAELIANMRR